jgi:carbamoyltransferase
MIYILGISCLYHDSAVALLKDGEIVFAIQEERLSRIKHDASFPLKSIKFIINKFNIKISDIDHIVFL